MFVCKKAVAHAKVSEYRVEANGSGPPRIAKHIELLITTSISRHELRNRSNLPKLAPTHSSPPLIATTYKKNAAIELFFKSTYFLEILGSKVIYLL